MTPTGHRHRATLPALVLAPALALALAGPAAALDTFTTGVNINDGGDTASADLYVSDVSVLDGKTCIGNSCADAEVFDANTTLKISAGQPWIEFNDASGSSFPDRDWRLLVNDAASGGLERFSIEDMTQNTIPFTIEGQAPSSALYLDRWGNLALGTSNPGASLHILRENTPTLRLEQSGVTWPAWTWDIQAHETFLQIADRGGGSSRYPFRLFSGNDDDTLVARYSLVGIGTDTPRAGLHVRRQQTDSQAALLVEAATTPAGVAAEAFAHFRSGDGDTRILIEETSTTVAPRALLALKNAGRPEIVMANTDTGGEWSFGAGTNFILKQGAVGSTSNAKTKLFEIDPAGNATLTGSLVTGGTTCGSGCDAVFRDDYALPSIPDHAARMQALGYLPNVGPTPEGAPFDVTDKLGRMLNELEHAHLYIAQLERETRQIPALRETARRLEADNAALAARLERLETALLPAAD
ncbi:MAG: hypothetical protein R3D85_15065 [Paracoccaceae bacterium]